MYVHIGKNEFVNSKDIIAIFDVKSLEKKNSLENICKNIKISDNIIDVSENNKKSLIIISKDNKVKGYITNISSITLGKRTSRYERMENK